MTVVRRITACTLALAIASEVPAAQWWRQAALPQFRTITDVEFVSPAVGWLVTETAGANSVATIWQTTDGGSSWQQQFADEPIASLQNIDCVDPSHCWAAGNALYRTTDGINWTRLPDNPGQSGTTYDLQFVSVTTGWRVYYLGGTPSLFRTTDGGVTWQAQTAVTLDSGADPPFHFASSMVGWAFGPDHLPKRTMDGGLTWQPFPSPDPAATAGTSVIHVFSSDEGYVKVEGVLHYTADGGRTWQAKQAGSAQAQTKFLDAATGWGIGFDESIAKTDDGGLTWDVQLEGNIHYLRGHSIVDAQTVFIAGTYGVILGTRDGGSTWKQLSSGSGLSVEAIDFVDRDEGWTAGANGEVLHTRDGGRFWARNTAARPPVNFRAVRAPDRDTVFAAGEFGFVVRTTDRGHSWEELTVTPTYFETIYALDFVGAATGWFGADYGDIYKTTNGGDTWNETPTPAVINWVSGIDFVDTSHGWAVGGNPGFVWHTSNGGATWQVQFAAGPSLWDVAFHDRTIGWAVGQDNRILHTTNGGQSWTSQGALDPDRRLNGVVALGPTEAYAVGYKFWTAESPTEGSFVVHTTDSGQTWSFEFQDYHNGSVGIASRGGRVWTFGARGMIYSTVPALRVDRQRIFWHVFPGWYDPNTAIEPVDYDLVRGDLSMLRATGGDFTAAVSSCLANDLGTISHAYAENPPAGSGHWFLVRGVGSNGNDTYESFAPSQAGARDAEIDRSPSSCP